MKFTYQPEGAEPRSWTFKPGKLLNVEAEKIEDLTGWTFDEFGQKFMAGSTKAYHALLYVYLRRETPSLKYSEVQFQRDEIDVDFDADERARMVEEMERNYDALDDDQRTLLDELKLQGIQESTEAAEESPKA